MSNHLKHCGPIRQARTAKRTALVEIQGDEASANEPMFTEADLLAADVARNENKAESAFQREYAVGLRLQQQREDMADWIARGTE